MFSKMNRLATAFIALPLLMFNLFSVWTVLASVGFSFAVGVLLFFVGVDVASRAGKLRLLDYNRALSGRYIRMCAIAVVVLLVWGPLFS